ncbi:histidine kinase [Streptomyces chartreusis]|uniref:histidine kinase n=1 Tax=Streptomyces chartreusis TaxID=1969 RepID=UPI0033D8791C
MFDPQVTVSALLGAGFAATSAGFIVQTRCKRSMAARGASLEEERDGAIVHAAALEFEVRHLAAATMPALVDVFVRGHRGVAVPGLIREQFVGTSVDEAHQAVRQLLEAALTATREQIGRAARSSVRDVIDEAQTRLLRCQVTVVQEMERHPNGTACHWGLMKLDHMLAQAMHTLQRTLILTGSWPGAQRGNCTIREVVESARGRINDPLRVAYTEEPGIGETWLEGRVVEPITVACTELLANATAYSDGKVFVEVQAFQTGYCLVVDDGGPNMNSFQREEAARQLAQSEMLDVTTLRDAGQLGFAVIGRLATEYGFAADVTSTSPYGGVRAALRIPRDLFGHGPTAEEIQAARGAAKSLSTESAFTAGSPAWAGDVHTTPDQQTGIRGLPRRRRRTPLPTAPARDSAPPPADDPEEFSASIAHLGRTIQDTEIYTTEGDHPHG